MSSPVVTIQPISRRDDLVLKALHASIWATVGLYFPYVNIYYRSIGLSGTQIGLIATASALIAIIGAVLWGMFNDRIGHIRRLFTIGTVGVIISALVLSQVRSFPLILLLAATLSFFSSPIFPLVDSFTLKTLGTDRQNYGKYRVWGTIGFVITCYGIGTLLTDIPLNAIFMAYSGGMLVFWVVSRGLPEQTVSRNVPLFSGLKDMVRQPAWAIFAASILLLWIASMGSLTFLGITIKEMGGTEQTIGLLSTISALAEIPVFLGGAWLLRRLGTRKMIAFAMLVYALRLVIYSVMPVYTWVLWAGPLQGLSYTPLILAAISYANDLAPDYLKATSQGLMASVFNLGSLAAGLTGGALFDSLGRQGLFGILSGVCILAFLLFTIGVSLQRRRMVTI